MKQSTSINSDSTLQSAQDATIQSIAKFEGALEHLAEKVENTSQRVEHVGEIVQRLKGDFGHLKSTAKNAVQPILPLMEQGRDISNRAISSARQNPKALFLIAAGIIGLFFASRSMQQSRRSFVSDTEY